MDTIEPRLPDLKSYVPESANEALSMQKALKDRVSLEDGFKSITKVAGVDLAILKEQKMLVCGIILFTYPGLSVIEKVYSVVEEQFPYIPGLLAFREGPSIIETYGKLNTKPDVLILDGQGTAHPRGFGIACHVGVILNVPSIGIAKKRLYGTHDEPGALPGDNAPLYSKEGREIGAVLRTKLKTKPVFVSPGHMVSLSTAVDIALECTRGYRVPEPTRLADKYVAELKREF